MNSQEQIDKIRKKAEADIAKINKEVALREALPVQPSSVHVYPLYETQGSFTYNVKTWQETLDIVEKFEGMPSYKHVKGGVSMRYYPPETDSKNFFDSAEMVLQINTLPKIEFFTRIGEEIWRVNINFPLHLIGKYTKDNPSARTRFRYIFEAKYSLASIANFGGVEHFGEGSKSMSYCKLTREQLKEWADAKTSQ